MLFGGISFPTRRSGQAPAFSPYPPQPPAATFKQFHRARATASRPSLVVRENARPIDLERYSVLGLLDGQQTYSTYD